jgi:acyl dehydratase
MFEMLQVEGIVMGVNYGLNKVRFPRPVPVGGRVRATAELTDVKGTPAGYLSNLKMTIELEGERRAVCIAETLSLYVPAG